MSAFSVCFNKKGRFVSKDVFLPMHAALEHYCVDDSRYIIDETVGFSYHAFWTTPEEEGEQQPIKFTGRYYVVWDGRIDNRQEIYQSLTDKKVSLNDLSDAQLFLRFYLEKGIKSLKNIIGPFAWVLFDKVERTLITARDSMGGRYLVYAETDEWCCIASTVNAITSHPVFSFELNKRLVAQHFSFNYVNEDSTFSKNVKLVLPGHFLQFSNAKKTHQQEYYLPNPRTRIRYKDKQEYSQHFRQLLSSAVEARLRTVTPIASMLSGGLDSAPITVEAANLLNGSKDLFGVTWTFDEHKQSDEREFLDEIYNNFSVIPVWVNCDDAYPLNQKDAWPVNPDRPFDYPYRGKHLRAYKAIQEKGCRVTLSGMAGDDLYSGTDLIVYEYLRELRLLAAYKELKQRAQYYPSFNLFFRTHFFWYTKLWFQLKGRSTFLSPHITHQAFDEMQEDKSFLGTRSQYALRPKQYDQLVGNYYSNTLATESFFSTPHQTELRYPMRDRRLTEYMLQIPSEQLYSNNILRPIIRNAYDGVLPEKIKSRRTKTGFQPLLSKIEGEAIEAKNQKDDNNWSYYVKSGWFNGFNALNINHLMIKWQILYWDFWVGRRKN